MTQLYSVSYTTQKLINKYDAKGKLVAQTRLDTPITHHALPYSTAMSYSGCDNFKIERYEMEDRFRSKGAGRDESVGSGTKKVDWSKTDRGMKTGEINIVMAGSDGKSKLREAASTGNLAAAISA